MLYVPVNAVFLFSTTLKVALPVMANIAQCLIDDWERITVADPEGFDPPAIEYPMEMK